MKPRKTLYILILLVVCGFQSARAQLFKEEVILENKGLINGKIINADFNNDNFIDILLSGEDHAQKQQIYFLKNIDGISFDSISTSLLITTGTSLYTMDFNNDGLIDIALMGTDTTNNPITKLYLNRGNFLFDASTAQIEPLHYGSVNSFDANNDGNKDLIVSGINKDGYYRTVIYKNHTGGLVEKKAELVALRNGKNMPLDFDNDGMIDVLINGIDSLHQPRSLLYQNKGDFTFVEIFEFDNITHGNVCAGDFNIDGKTDLLLAGADFEKNFTTFLYLNDSSRFVTLRESLPGLNLSFAQIADLNHDGHPEIFMAGFDRRHVSQIYILEGDTSHLEKTETVKALSNNAVSLADLNNDGNLDIVETGGTASSNIVRILMNQTSQPNSGPLKPTNPVVIPMKDKAFFFWSPPADDVTPSTALTYDIYVSKSSPYEDVKSPESDLMTGYRRVVTHGAQGQSNHYLLNGLTDGTYYWGVQAIDNSFKGDATGSDGGFCQGGGGSGFELCFIINTIDTTVCKNSILKIQSPFKDRVYIFSEKKGFLGGFFEYDYVANHDDELYIVSTNYRKCTESLNYVIKLAPSENLNLGNDRIVCKNDTITISAGAEWKEVKWLVDNNFVSTSNNLILSVSQRVKIKAEVVNDIGCRYTDEVAIDVYESPFTVIKDYTINLGESADLTATGGLTYHWVTPSGPDESSSASLPVSPKRNSTYYLSGMDTNGCPFTDSVNVKVKGDLFVPNLFSPNGDGANDNFKVYAANVREIRLQIYDRNGVLVFNGENEKVMEHGWDGRKDNVLQAPGVYIWTVTGKYIDGRPLVYDGKQKGIVRLIR